MSGNDGSSSHPNLPFNDGSAGTVYRDCDNDVDHLILNNGNRESPQNTIITDKEKTFFNITTLEIIKKARVAFKPEAVEAPTWVRVDVLHHIGDKSGTLHVFNYTNVVLRDSNKVHGSARVNTESFATTVPHNELTGVVGSPRSATIEPVWHMIADEGAKITMPDHLTLDNTWFILRGRLSGPRYIHLRNHSYFHMKTTASTDARGAAANTFGTDILKVELGAHFVVPQASKIYIHDMTVGGDAETKAGVLDVVKSSRLELVDARVTSAGKINGVSFGYPAKVGPGTSTECHTTGSGCLTNRGASHGGRGAVARKPRDFVFVANDQWPGIDDPASEQVSGGEGGYGSYARPATMGSGAGGYRGGAGGSALHLVAETLRVDGVLTMDGQKGSPGTGHGDYGGGGGAGGSILLEIDQMSGAGTVRASGGAGGTGERYYRRHGGGGGGGRIALLCKNTDFSGAWQAFGGLSGNDGSSSHPNLPFNDGSAGTVYRDCDNDVDHLILNNGNRESPQNTIITDKEKTFFNITTLEIIKKARVAFKPEAVEAPTWVRVDVLHHIGDKSGTLHVFNYTNVVLRDSNKVHGSARVNTESFATTVPHNELTGVVGSPRSATIEPVWHMIADEGAKITMPDHLTLDNTWFILRGRLSGPRYIHLRNHSYFHMKTTASTDARGAAANTFGTDILKVELGAHFVVPQASKIYIHDMTVGGDAETKAGVLDVVKSSRLELVDARVTSAGKINGVGFGHAKDSGPGHSNGQNCVSSCLTNRGGSHGGRGGGQSDELTGTLGGYGSYLRPLVMGSGGSSDTAAGGAGGSAVHFLTKTFQVFGEVIFDGASGESGECCHNRPGGGGGAGGSILLNVTESLSGTGTIRAAGGAGGKGYRCGNCERHGGAGGGGRIALHCKSDEFDGLMLAHGGAGSLDGATRYKTDRHAHTDGSAGTVYINCDNHRDHLILDNKGLVSGETTLITDKLVTHFSILKLEIKRNARVGFKPEGVNEKAAITVDLETQIGDTTGTLDIIHNTVFLSKGNVGDARNIDPYSVHILRDGETDSLETLTRRHYFGVSLQAQYNIVVDANVDADGAALFFPSQTRLLS